MRFLENFYFQHCQASIANWHADVRDFVTYLGIVRLIESAGDHLGT